MKRTILLALVAFVFANTVTFAQSLQTATLSHADTIKAYYGYGALKEAVEAAVDGDVITLSSGQFDAVEIEKYITIRGAGWDTDTITNRQPTVISGGFTIKRPSTAGSQGKFRLESIYNDGIIQYRNNTNIEVVKCRLGELKHFSAYNEGRNSYLTIIQSRITKGLEAYSACEIVCINSYISTPFSDDKKYSIFYMTNCIIDATNLTNICSSHLNNCIINTSNSTTYLQASNEVDYCVCVNENAKQAFQNMTNKTNKIASKEIFKSYTGTYSDLETFSLTDKAAKEYLGEDGTQVGMYGGNMPYTTALNHPQITKFNVDTKSSSDGKLKVNIEVKAAK